MKIFVLGSNSFSGATFVEHALGRGAEVVGISRSEEADPVFLPYRWHGTGFAAPFRFHRMDINHDLDAMTDLILRFEPAWIVNFAAQSMVAESWDSPEDWMMTNVLSTVKLHDRLRRFSFLEKYVHVSTPEVYGSTSGTVREDAPYNPSTPYAVSRAACDMSLETFRRNYGFPVVFTRAANVFGPGQQLYRIIPRTILFARLGRKLPLHGGGRSVRSFIHARDVADGTLRAALRAEPGDIFHLSTERSISIRDLVSLTCERMGVDFDDAVEISGDRPGKDAAYLLDSTRAREKLDWSDAIGLEEGIDETIEWVTNNLDTLRTMPLEYLHRP